MEEIADVRKDACKALIDASEGIIAVFVKKDGKVAGHCYGSSDKKLTRDLFDACGDFGKAIRYFEEGNGTVMEGEEEDFHVIVSCRIDTNET